MVVQHNMQAANANRMLNVTTGQQAKSTEKLSSGYRINRAADDAAGLTISEKMRKQIKGLDRASTNAEDGVSAVQTAEGALTEVHSMLQRMNELATQASNGTNSESDRSAIQDEISQLTTEIDRVAETTKFNETYLLKGDTDGSSSAKNVNAHDAGLAGKLVDNGDGTSTFKLDKALEDGDQVTIAGKKYTIGSTTASTDGFEKLDSLKNKSLAVGDSVTYTDNNNQVTKTLVDKVSNVGTAADIYKTGDKIKIDNEEYTIDQNTDLSGTKLSADDAQKLVSEAIANGKEASFTAKAAATGMYAANATINVKIVADLGENEVSSLKPLGTHTAGDAFKAKNLKPAGAEIVAGDSVTISGKAITATDNDPANMSTVKDVVKSLQKNDAMQIGGKTIKIADKTDIANNEYTVNDALSLLNDKNTVNFDAVTSAEGKAALTVSGLKASTDYTAVDTKKVASDDNVISVKDAYSMMADELQKASSIGTDTAATVKSDNSGSFTINQGTVEVKNGLSFNLHVGADADMTNKINVNIDSMNASGLGIKGLNVKDDSGIAATYAIDAIADAISKVSEQRSALGAVQNRLEHTISNVDNVVENTTSAESRIRDTDMASEMVNYSKNNILAQAGQSMLAQANQSNQGVLSLLQ
ncbi:flagellin N-terminal helical domain-containing protein [Agathobacter sp.]